MGADAVAAIRSALLELEAALAEPHKPGAGDLCASFEVEPRSTPWVQVVLDAPDTLNIYYPFADSANGRLRQLSRVAPSNLELVTQEPGAYATFSFTWSSPMELARFIDAVFVDLLGCRGEYPLTVRLFHLPEVEQPS